MGCIYAHWIGKNASNAGAAAPTVSEGTVILQLK
jgi:hypothetical protein